MRNALNLVILPQNIKAYENRKMKVLLYLKKSGLDKLGKAPIMGRITIGHSIAQFSCKLSCNPDLWNPRESRMDGKSREAVEVNGRLENLLLSIQSAYQSLLASVVILIGAAKCKSFAKETER